MNKKELSFLLSKLSTFDESKIKLEQYQTEAEIAASILWMAYMNGDIVKKKIADFGCGNGIFGIGALILGAKKTCFADLDKEAIELAKENLALIEEILNNKFDAEFFNLDLKDFEKRVDVVIQNPPFGVKKEHADKEFLEKAMEKSNVIYSIHKIESLNFIEKLAKDNDFSQKLIWEFDFPLKKIKSYHKKKVYNVEVGLWRLENER